MIGPFARAVRLKFGEGVGLRRLSLHSAVVAGVLAVAVGSMGTALGDSSDMKSPQAAVAGNDPNYFLANPFALSSQPRLKQSVFGFAGRTNSGNLGSTFAFGSGAPEAIFFDNYIAGGAYQRDFVQFNSGVFIGAEVGLADRFGSYSLCCDRVVHSNRMVHSAEVWGGISVRHEGLALFDAIRISPGFVFGLSAISNPIGQEALHQFDHQGSAKVLFYLGFDLAFALANFPNTELVLRIHHRSGGYGTLGGLKEGNNANVVGIRHRF